MRSRAGRPGGTAVPNPTTHKNQVSTVGDPEPAPPGNAGILPAPTPHDPPAARGLEARAPRKSCSPETRTPTMPLMLT